MCSPVSVCMYSVATCSVSVCISVCVCVYLRLYESNAIKGSGRKASSVPLSLMDNKGSYQTTLTCTYACVYYYMYTCTYDTHTHTHSQRSVGGAAGVMQRRLEELEAAIKKLEEDKAELKQENAALVRERERERVRRERERKREGGIVWGVM